MSELRRGTLYGAAAYALWGLFPLYWPLLEPAGAVEILAHRIVWSLGVVLLILGVQRRLGWFRELLARPRALALLTVAALVISVNWCTYIYGVNNGHVVETSLGYFINPLVTVMLGVVVLREEVRGGQWVALALGALAVIVLTADYGRPPWIALTLAFSFATYGLVKKKAAVGAVESLSVETLLLVVPAAVWLLLLESRGDGRFGHFGVDYDLLLVTSGVVTAVPLLFFGAAANRIPLVVLGLLQYLAPVVQFLLGVLYFDEPMPPVRLVGFLLVWAALAVFTADGIARRRRQLRLAAEAVG